LVNWSKEIPDDHSELKDYFDTLVDKVNNAGFIPDDPISVPHRFSKLQDIEIAAFLTAILSWGKRKTIINKATELIARMDNEPYDFVVNHTEKERASFLSFKHRTFQATDTLYFLDFLQRHYSAHASLEKAFYPDASISYDQKKALIYFHNYFFSGDSAPKRTQKHIATPARKSTCKRLNMLLRWMVRQDSRKVDFGLWKSIPMSSLMIPLDVHVENYARSFGLLTRKQRDWMSVEEITDKLKVLDPYDPVKYDYALFGLGIMNKSDF
jgi:uncharacterized protein (TIGR02757 family)